MFLLQEMRKAQSIISLWKLKPNGLHKLQISGIDQITPFAGQPVHLSIA